jgi:predicted permease
MILKIIIFWVICFCITLGWNLQKNKEIKFSNIIVYLIFGPILTLAIIGVILRCIYEHLNKE